jgi:hypothetical protein
VNPPPTRLADNFEFRGDSRLGRPEEYGGLWQKYIRDIDSSCLLKIAHVKKSNNLLTKYFTLPTI